VHATPSALGGATTIGGMTPGDLVNTVFLAFVAAGLGALFWTRLNRLEEKIDTRASVADLNALRTELKGDINTLRTEVRVEFAEVRREIAALRTEVREDVGTLRTEFRVGFAEVRREVGGLRSDITQVALGVDPRPPRAQEG
jgi:ribosomal protein L29